VHITIWFLIIGALLISMALASSLVKRLPLNTATLYLAVGFGLGPVGVGLLSFDPVKHAAILRLVTELALIISLFSAGLKLRSPLFGPRWQSAARLAIFTMLATIALLTAVGVFYLNLPLGAAVLLGAILAPTDPVLASDVQVENAGDQDRVRFSLTGEAGANDGIAYPFFLLGLGLLGLHDLGALGWRWLAVDFAWDMACGIAIGGVLGTLIGHLVLYLRREHREAVGLDEFLALGLMALAYGLALLLGGDGFLAVFAAGIALRRVEHQASGERSPDTVMGKTQAGKEKETATHPEKAPAYMAKAVLGFNQQLERLGEVHVVLLTGGLLLMSYFSGEALVLALLLFVIIRPLAVRLALVGSGASPVERNLMAWFGIRGIGSLFYLLHAVEFGLPTELAQRMISLVLTVVAASIVVHGVSATPLMKLHHYRQGRRK
jgi:sodium/hydrogen antiporter